MTILFFARRFYPYIGGVEKHVLEVSKRLVKRGHRVIVVTEYEKNTNSSSYQSLSSSATIEGIEIYRINAGRDDKFKKLRIWLQLLKHLQLIKSADIIHCHDIFFWYLPFRFLFPFKKVYTTFHGYEGNNLPTKKAIFMHKIAEKLSFGNICIGDYLVKWYGTKANAISYGAVNIPNNLPKVVNIKNFKNVLYIGRLEQEAGIMEYLEILAILKKKGYDLKLTVLGDGSQRHQAEEFVSKNKLDVDFKGFVKETYDYLPSADVVFTSRFLGTLESLIFKKLIFVVYNNAIKKDCFYMSPFSEFIILENKSEGLAKSFLEYIKNPKIAENKINKAYKWVSKQTWDKLVGQYLALWNIKLVD